MSRRRRQPYRGCSIVSRRGKLRLRWRASIQAADGSTRAKHVTYETGYADTPENRKLLERLAEVVGKVQAAGGDPRPTLDELTGRQTFSAYGTAAPPASGSDAAPGGRTFREYFGEWYAALSPTIHPSRAHYIRRDMKLILSEIGDCVMADFQPRDVWALQATLLRHLKPNGEPVSQKYIQNVLGTGFRKMCKRAVIEGELRCDPFFGLEWQPYDPPEADPFEPEERDRIITWFAHKRFSFHAGPGAPSRMRLHLPLHAYVHFLFWHGARPSEASGLRVQDVDLKRGLAHVRQSFHMHRPGRPKTKTARRTIELHPETLQLFAAVMPLRPEPEAPLLCNTEGRYIHPAGFLRRPWRECLAALRIRHRGLYA